MQQDSLGRGPLDQVWQVISESGDAPLYEAVHWVATKGGSGSVVFRPDLWPDAWIEVASAWRENKLAVSGRPSGRPATNHSYPEKISGDNIIGVRSVPPYPLPVSTETLSLKPETDRVSYSGAAVIL